MAENDDLRQQIELVYREDVQPHQIPREISLSIGRLLVAGGYKCTGSYLLARDSELTIRSMIKEFDQQVRYQKSTKEDIQATGVIVGPYYYIADNGKEFCPIGIGIWVREPE